MAEQLTETLDEEQEEEEEEEEEGIIPCRFNLPKHSNNPDNLPPIVVGFSPVLFGSVRRRESLFGPDFPNSSDFPSMMGVTHVVGKTRKYAQMPLSILLDFPLTPPLFPRSLSFSLYSTIPSPVPPRVSQLPSLSLPYTMYSEKPPVRIKVGEGERKRQKEEAETNHQVLNHVHGHTLRYQTYIQPLPGSRARTLILLQFPVSLHRTANEREKNKKTPPLSPALTSFYFSVGQFGEPR